MRVRESGSECPCAGKSEKIEVCVMEGGGRQVRWILLRWAQ